MSKSPRFPTLTGAWLQANISVSDNGKIEYPISLVGLLLDAAGSPAISGQIFIDEMIIGG